MSSWTFTGVYNCRHVLINTNHGYAISGFSYSANDEAIRLEMTV